MKTFTVLGDLPSDLRTKNLHSVKPCVQPCKLIRGGKSLSRTSQTVVPRITFFHRKLSTFCVWIFIRIDSLMPLLVHYRHRSSDDTAL